MINASLLQMVIDASNDGIVIAEKEGEQDNILIYVNPAFERLTGYTSEEILYQDCRFFAGRRQGSASPRLDSAGIGQWWFLPGNPQKLPQGRHPVLERTVAFHGKKTRTTDRPILSGCRKTSRLRSRRSSESRSWRRNWPRHRQKFSPSKRRTAQTNLRISGHLLQSPMTL